MKNLKFKIWYIFAEILAAIYFLIAFVMFKPGVSWLIVGGVGVLLALTPWLNLKLESRSKKSEFDEDVFKFKKSKEAKERLKPENFRINIKFYSTAFFTVLFLFMGVFFNNVAIFFVGMALFFSVSISLLDILLKRQAIGAAELEKRTFRSKIFAGENLDVRVKMNSGRYPLDVFELLDEHPETLSGDPVFVRPQHSVEQGYSFKCNSRGRHYLGPLWLVSQDRFGYFKEEVRLAGEEKITVYPSLETIHKMEMSRKGRQLGKLYGIHQTRQIGIGSELHGIRDYQPTDEYRRIAWKHFARHSTLMSKEFEGEKNVTVLICIDCGRAMGIGELPNKLEYSIQAVTMLCKMADERGDSFGIVAFSNGVKSYLKPGRGKIQFGKLLETLADIKSAGQTSYTSLSDFVCGWVRRSTLTVIISDFEGDFNDIGWGIKKLRARGHQVLAICPFTPYFEASSKKDQTLDAVSSALVRSLKRRHLMQTKKELKKLGVDCIDVGPKDFLPIVAEKFLEKKKLGAALL